MRAVLICLTVGLLSCVTALAQPNVVAWGSGSATTIPNDLVDAVQVSAGKSHAVALCANGDIETWGDDSYGQLDLTNLHDCAVSQVIAGYDYTAVLYTDETVSVHGRWNQDWSGGVIQSNVVEIASATTNVLLCRLADGHVKQFGTNWYDTTFASSVPPGAVMNVVSIAATPGRFGAVRSDGRVFMWGPGSHKTVAHNATNAVLITMTADSNIVVRADSTGVISDGNSSADSPVTPAINVDARGFSTHGVILKDDGSVKVAEGSEDTSSLPPVQAVSAGDGFGIGIVQP